jgi:hypothetical protein
MIVFVEKLIFEGHKLMETLSEAMVRPNASFMPSIIHPWIYPLFAQNYINLVFFTILNDPTKE